MNNIGYIYKITNKINNKCYIGQTTKTLEERWTRHKKDAFNLKASNYEYPLYKAFRKYGLENFSFELIEKCEIAQLDEKEIYWINFYDSAKHNGYNQCLGGKGNKQLELDELQITKTYSELQNINKTAEIYNCSKSTIAQILKKHNIPIISAEEHAKEKGYTIKQFDKNHKYLKSFNNIIDAAQEIINSNKGTTIKATREAIRIACLSGYLTYGFYWINDEYNDEYIKSYNNKTKNRKQNKKPSPQIPCPLCGNLMSSHSTICISCHNQQNSDNAIKEKQEKGITREFLKQEIRNKSFTQIGKEQGVSDNAIRKWCKLYNLPSKSSEIKKYSDEEWESI